MPGVGLLGVMLTGGLYTGHYDLVWIPVLLVSTATVSVQWNRPNGTCWSVVQVKVDAVPSCWQFVRSSFSLFFSCSTSDCLSLHNVCQLTFFATSCQHVTEDVWVNSSQIFLAII